MLDGLDDIPWHELEQCGGFATDAPDILRAMASADEDVAGEAHFDRAIQWMREADVFPVTAAVIPFMVELASLPVMHHRHKTLSFPVQAGVFEARSYPDRPYGIRRMIATVAEPLVRLLSDPDPIVRALAASALGQCDGSMQAVGRDLHDRWAAEDDSRARAALVASAVACDRESGAAWAHEAYLDRAPAVRAAAVFATAVNGFPWTEQVLAVLTGCWTGEEDPLPSDYPWLLSDGSWLLDVLKHLNPDQAQATLSALNALPSAGAHAAAEYASWWFSPPIG